MNFTDIRALNHILVSHSYDYPKPEATRGEIRRLLGQGVLFAEGATHPIDAFWGPLSPRAPQATIIDGRARSCSPASRPAGPPNSSPRCNRSPTRCVPSMLDPWSPTLQS